MLACEKIDPPTRPIRYAKDSYAKPCALISLWSMYIFLIFYFRFSILPKSHPQRWPFAVNVRKRMLPVDYFFCSYFPGFKVGHFKDVYTGFYLLPL